MYQPPQCHNLCTNQYHDAKTGGTTPRKNPSSEIRKIMLRVFPVGFDITGQASTPYRIRSLPASFLIDAQGKITEEFNK